MDAEWPLRARLCTCPEISPESNSVSCRLYKSLGWDYTDSEVPRVLRTQNWDYHVIRTLKTCPALWEFGELWKQQNNPVCTKMIIMANFVANGRRRSRSYQADREFVTGTLGLLSAGTDAKGHNSHCRVLAGERKFGRFLDGAGSLQLSFPLELFLKLQIQTSRRKWCSDDLFPQKHLTVKLIP